MTRFLSSDLWPSLEIAAETAQDKRIAVAYFTQDYLRLAKDDVLVTDASNSAISSGQTSAQVLTRLYKRGVEIYSCEGLHAKVVVLDGLVFVSSANLSVSSASENGLIEAGVVSDSEPIRRAVLAFIDQLKRKLGTRRVDARFISRIEGIEVKKTWRPGVKGANVGIDPLDEKKQKYWMLPTVPIDEPKDPAERRRIAKGEKIAEKRLVNPKRLFTIFSVGGRGRRDGSFAGLC
ncbi:MAG: phospholipase D-like domain-containing protein [Edaphobacter sp.]